MFVIIFQQPKASAEPDSIAEAVEDDDVFEGETQKRKANDVTGGDEDESGIEKKPERPAGVNLIFFVYL
jgi:hypothetical protein